MSKSQCKKSVQDYFSTQKKYKTMCERFEKLKKDFYADMEQYFQANKINEDGLKIDSDFVNVSNLSVKRVQNVKVTFNAEKLEKVLPTEISDDVILKEYKIIDMPGLVTYLKQCGVDPKVFKSFLNVKKSVDTKELERLEQIGKIDFEQLKGCYTVKANEPYFKVTAGKDEGEKD